MSKKKEELLNVYKVAMLGCKGTGKTCMVNQYVNGCFDQTSDNGYDFREYYKLVNVNKDTTKPQYCILKIVDVFGVNDEELENVKKGNVKAELMSRITENKNPEKKPEAQSKKKKFYLKDKKIYAYMFVYDVTQPDTLEEIVKYIKYIYNIEKKQEDALITKKFLVANKMDKVKTVPQHKALGEATRYGVVFLECSALEKDDVISCFEKVAKGIYTDEKFRAYDKDMNEKENTEVETTKKTNKRKKDEKEEDDEDEDDDEKAKKEKVIDLNAEEDDYEKLKTYPKIEEAKASSGGCNMF